MSQSDSGDENFSKHEPEMGEDSDHSQILNDSAVLDEDSSYEPGEDEVKEYAQFLGMDLEEHADLLWIAREGLKAPLPAPWKPCKTKDDPPKMYYFNFETGESSWEYPCDKQYKELFQAELAKRDRDKGVSIKLFTPGESKVQEHSPPTRTSGAPSIPVRSSEKVSSRNSSSLSQQTPSLDQQLRENRHSPGRVELTAEVTRLANQLNLAELKLGQVTTELGASRALATDLKEKLASSARSEASTKASLAVAIRERDEALAELSVLRQRLKLDGHSAKDVAQEEHVRAQLQIRDHEWDLQLASVKGMVSQLKGLLESSGALAQGLENKFVAEH